MLAITTFSPQGYEQYGFRCVEGLSRHFPGKIVAYTEKDIPPVERVETRDFFSIPGVTEYLERVKKHPGADGNGPDGYDYRYNADAFCRKVFAQDAVFDEDELVFWFDSDCVILKAIPEELLSNVCGGNALAYMGRRGKLSYTETGWIGFSTKHPDFKKFRGNYLSYFTTGRIFGQLKGWHDCIAFDHARQDVPARNISPQGTGVQSVMQDTLLAPYVAHLKGNRKFSKIRVKKLLSTP